MKPRSTKKTAAPKKTAAKDAAAGERVAFAIVRNRNAYEAEADFDVPKAHVLVAAIPIPEELGFADRAGGVIVSINPKRLWAEPAIRLGIHGVVGVALVDRETIETPVATGPAYEGEPVPLKLERFMDKQASPYRRSKIGGHPFHYNEPSPSECGKCRTPTVWALHLSGELFDETFGDSGSLYIYLCPKGCEAHSIIDLA